MGHQNAYIPGLKFVANVSLVYPLALLALLYAQWLLAWWNLGRRPIAWEDDPYYMCGTGGLHVVVVVLMIAAIPMLFLDIVANAAYAWKQLTFKQACARACPLLGAWLSLCVWMRIDPNGVVKWWID